MSDRLTDEALAEFAEGHRKADNPNSVMSRDGQPVDYCHACEHDWPCLTVRVRDEVERWRAFGRRVAEAKHVRVLGEHLAYYTGYCGDDPELLEDYGGGAPWVEARRLLGIDAKENKQPG